VFQFSVFSEGMGEFTSGWRGNFSSSGLGVIATNLLSRFLFVFFVFFVVDSVWGDQAFFNKWSQKFLRSCECLAENL